MFLAEFDRRRFVEMLSAREPLRRDSVTEVDESCRFPRFSEMLLLWRDDPRQHFSLPSAVIVESQNARDFLAWVATYVRNIRPFTAHCRVLDLETAMMASRADRFLLQPNVASSCAGLILGEAVAHLAGLSDPRRLTYHACASTLSFVLARAMRLYGIASFSDQQRFLPDLADAWVHARDLTGQQPSAFDTSRALAPWAALSALHSEAAVTKTQAVSVPPLVVSACRELRGGGDIASSTWRQLTDGLPASENVLEVLSGPREQRVLATEAAVSELATAAKSDLVSREFIAGYAVSRVNPGSLDHFALLSPSHQRLPGSYLWYGLIAGLAPKSGVRDSIGGLGWTLSRELGRSSYWLSRPTCDIALNELAVLAGNADAVSDIRTLGSSVISVELFPSMNATMRWPSPSQVGKRSEDVQETRTHASQQKMFGDSAGQTIDVDLVRRGVERIVRELDSLRSMLDQDGSERGSKRRRR